MTLCTKNLYYTFYNKNEWEKSLQKQRMFDNRCKKLILQATGLLLVLLYYQECKYEAFQLLSNIDRIFAKVQGFN